MRKNYTVLYILFILLLFAGCKASELESYDLVITNVNVVDVQKGAILSNRTVVIDDGEIVANTEGKTYRTTSTIDAKGQFLIPGLWDNHIHLRGGETLVNENRNMLPLFIANGITTVRDAGGDLYPHIQEWQKQIAAGQLTGPRIISSGPKLDGPKPTWEGSIEVGTVAEVPAAMDSLQKLGVDFVKIYDSTISGDVFLAIVKEAEQRGLHVTGHMPFTITLSQAMDLGLDATEHLYYVFKASSIKEDSLTQAIKASQATLNPIAFHAALRELYKTYSPEQAEKVFRALAENNTAVVPTLYISRVLNNLQQDDHSADDYLVYMGNGIIETYARRINSAKRQSPESVQFMRDLNATFHSMIPEMQEAGVTILAGSDCGAFNSYIYPGISLHKELELLVKAGLTPAQALKTATINGAEVMGRDKEYGTVETGKVADLVMLRKNPLENISHTQEIESVIVGGKVYSKIELTELLEELKIN